jgi:hypothetical protein
MMKRVNNKAISGNSLLLCHTGGGLKLIFGEIAAINENRFSFVRPRQKIPSFLFFHIKINRKGNGRSTPIHHLYQKVNGN